MKVANAFEYDFLTLLDFGHERGNLRIRPAGCLEPASLALEIGKRECAVFEFGEPVSPNPERCGGMAGNFDFRLGVILIAHSR